MTAALLFALAVHGAWAEARAPAAERSSRGRLILDDVRIIGMRDAPDPPRATVIVDDGTIVGIVEPSVAPWRLGDTLVRGDGRWLMPGLHDAAIADVDAADLRMMVYAGVTSVTMPDALLARSFRLLEKFEQASLPTIIAPQLRGDSGLVGRDAAPPAGSTASNRRLPVATRIARSRWSVESDAAASTSAAALAAVDPQRRERWLALTATERGRAELQRLEDERAARLRSLAADALPGSGALTPFQAPGTALLEELAALEAVGWDRTAILRAATRGSAEALGRARAGRIEVGAAADLLLLDADPREGLAALASPRMVVLRGRPIYRSEMLAAAGTLERLRAAQSGPFGGFEALKPGAMTTIFAARWQIDVDGFPRAAVRCIVELDGERILTRVQQDDWEPSSSRTALSRAESVDGATDRMTIDFRSQHLNESLELEFDPGADRWTLRWSLDDERGSRSVERSVMDGWPIQTGVLLMPTDVRRLAAAPEGSEHEGPSISFGVEPTAIRRAAVRRIPIAALSELASAVAAGPGERLVGLAYRESPSRAAPIMVLPVPAEPPAAVAVVVVDRDGWPRRAVLGVPDGIIQAHLLERAGALPR